MYRSSVALASRIRRIVSLALPRWSCRARLAALLLLCWSWLRAGVDYLASARFVCVRCLSISEIFQDFLDFQRL